MFVERLIRAIKLQVKNEEARKEVLEEMALTNANEQCKAAILNLPLEPVPTLDVMLHVLHAAAGEAIILHYTDDMLVCAPNDDLLSHALDRTIDSLVAAGFELQEEKIGRMPPWKYLGLEIGNRTIVPQKLVVKNNIKTLTDVQQLCGSLNWWERVEKSKKDRDCRDPLLIIEWVLLSQHRSKRMTRPQELVAELIRKARTRIRELAGSGFECIHIPIEINSGQITKAMLEHLIHENEAL
ncbi:hypothetical protein DUI87_21544 [Hirundo rustica rustica]|uniref:ribonuclease H n=1 Tax=Hirundo rustica rustica TaxID=333673 RepID=A0A3M0JTC8_HIRRU|nr:hypothetical protein DUI87_21544 [Hirundo rustica rustica]